MPLRFDERQQPVPPLDLIQRVVPPFPASEADGARRAFDEAAVPHLVASGALSLLGREFSDFERMLDFGCGPGRYMRHLAPLAGRPSSTGGHRRRRDQVVQENLPYGQFEVIPHEPPTSYPDHHFDLILNHSVFTPCRAELRDDRGRDGG